MAQRIWQTWKFKTKYEIYQRYQKISKSIKKSNTNKSGGRLSLGSCTSTLWWWALPAFPYDRWELPYERCFSKPYGAFCAKDICAAPLLNFLCRASLFSVVSVLPPITGKEKLNNNKTQCRNLKTCIWKYKGTELKVAGKNVTTNTKLQGPLCSIRHTAPWASLLQNT